MYANGVEFSGEGTAASRIANINASVDGRVAYSYDASTGAPSGSRVEYYHNDHLGNVRLAFSDLDGNGAITVGGIYDPTNEITQERHYYPFGLTHTGAWFATVAPEDAYRYNGIEFDEATQNYLAAFRSYDPSIGRWLHVDPLAEWAPNWSPYRFGFNNPVLYSDPFGLFESRKEARKHRRRTKGINIFNSRVKKQKDGSFSIDTRTASISKETNPEILSALGIKEESAIVVSSKVSAPKYNSEESYLTYLAPKIEPLSLWDYAMGRNQQNNFSYNRDGYATGLTPKGGGGGLELIAGGTGMAVLGMARVSKKAWGLKVGLGGSKKTLLTTALIHRQRTMLGLGNELWGVQRWTPFGRAAQAATYYGRWTSASLIGGGAGIAGYSYYDYLRNK